MGAPPNALRQPSFLQGVPPKRAATPLDFAATPTPGRGMPAVRPALTPTAARPSPPMPAITAPVPPPSDAILGDDGAGPAEPSGLPAALAEFRPPPTPPPPGQLRGGAQDEVLRQALEALKLQTERLAELARSDALEIGFMVAERILEQEVSTNPRALMALVRSAMRRLADARQVTVQLSPVDHERLSQRLASGDPDAAAMATVKLESDPTLHPGDCKVHSELGQVDGKLSTRLSEVRRAVEKVEGD